jgi:hypothetical protein
MKKVCVVLLLMLLSFFIKAQRLTGGFFASPNLTWLKPVNTTEIKNEGLKLGFSYGILGDYRLLGKNFTFNMGIVVNRMGGKIGYNDSIPHFITTDSTYAFSKGVVIDYKLTYISFPLGLKGKTNEIGYITYFMKGGLTPMFHFRSKADATQNNVTDMSIPKEVARLAMSYYIGGGIEYNLGGTTSLLIELVFTNGLTDITNTVRMFRGSERQDLIIQNNLALRLGVIF